MKQALLTSTWRLTQGWKVLGSIPKAHSLTHSILQSKNLLNYSMVILTNSNASIHWLTFLTTRFYRKLTINLLIRLSYSYWWSIMGQSGLQYLSRLPAVMKWATPNRLTHIKEMMSNQSDQFPSQFILLPDSAFIWAAYSSHRGLLSLLTLDKRQGLS